MDKAIKTLEFDKIREMLVSCAPFEGAGALCRAISPATERSDVEGKLTQTSEAKKLLMAKGMPSFGGVRDVVASLERAEKGASMSPRELLEVASLLSSVRRVHDYFFGGNEEHRDNRLDIIFSRLVSDRYLEQKIGKAIIAEDMIADEASPALSDIRRKIKNANNKIKDSLQKYASGAFGKYLQENIVTMRNGRYVVPVKAEYKSEIKGLVHDTSASGATLFIEPLAVVDANNELRALESKEKHEIDRILAELSSECASSSEVLILNYYNLCELGYIFARAELSCRMNAVEPDMNEQKRIRLRKARHPLIDKGKVVPINIELGTDFDTMVITGPNTGGKTVCLKTLGLLCLMAQAGLHIPASEGSEICIFEKILADIGDEQSIEQSLSTFSSHMVNIVGIMSVVNDSSLVLFDELGAGTDPTEGAALAGAIIEKVREKGALCAATTHYAEMKAYALETEGVTNASCEFDVETLKPTYRLIIGAPGKSNAFAISGKLGISEDIIEAAKAKISTDNKRFERVIEELEKNRLEAERARDEAYRSRKEFEQYRSTEEKRLKERLDAAEKELEKSREKAVRMVESARISSDYVMSQLEEIKKQKEKEGFSKSLEDGRRNIRRALREAGDSVNPVEEITDTEYVLPRELRKGDTVLIVNLGQKGVLADDPDKNGNVTVKTGLLNTKTNIKKLKLVEEAVTISSGDKKRIDASKYRAAVNKSFSPSLDLRGQMSDEAWLVTDKYLDEAIVARVKTVTLIHGKGTGALRAALQKQLKNDYRVKSFRSGIYGEGDSGVTVVELK